MSTSWMIPTNGDPLGTVRELIGEIWKAADLDLLLAPLNGRVESTGPEFLNDPADLSTINPFTPLMPINAAGMVPELTQSGEKTAAMLRPCEMRTLTAMAENDEVVKLDNLLTICVDCLGTLPVDEFQWRARRKGSPKGLASEALQFAHQGGIVPYRYRAACQICLSPGASEADINIGVLGLPVRQSLIISINNEDITDNLTGNGYIPVDSELLEHHQRIVNRLVARGLTTRERISKGLVEVLPEDVGELVEQLISCDDCTTCIKECPLCLVNAPHRDAQGRFNKDAMESWLISCSSCGICEQACPQHLPLTVIFGHIRDLLSRVQ
jgi:ferredoxin